MCSSQAEALKELQEEHKKARDEQKKWARMSKPTIIQVRVGEGVQSAVCFSPPRPLTLPPSHLLNSIPFHCIAFHSIALQAELFGKSEESFTAAGADSETEAKLHATRARLQQRFMH